VRIGKRSGIKAGTTGDERAGTPSMAEDTIALFDGCAISADRARAVILEYAETDIIREWHVVTASSAAPDRCYASVHSSARAGSNGSAFVIGTGATPLAALADLLWRLVTPHLIAGTR
jgi:hypothetical protein